MLGRGQTSGLTPSIMTPSITNSNVPNLKHKKRAVAQPSALFYCALVSLVWHFGGPKAFAALTGPAL
jgi:hypothetical protein